MSNIVRLLHACDFAKLSPRWGTAGRARPIPFPTSSRDAAKRTANRRNNEPPNSLRLRALPLRSLR